MWVPRPGPVDQAVRFFETPVAFASLCPRGVETGVAFAGEKRVFLARFSVAEVLSVSASPLCCVLCAKKFALRARNTPNLTFLRLLGEFCRGLSGGGAVPGEFCRVCRPATVPGTVPGPTLPRPCHRPRNSPWPDTTPALPLPTGTAAWPVGTAISHAIPQQLVQTLNLHRWNCNVFWVC